MGGVKGENSTKSNGGTGGYSELMPLIEGRLGRKV